MFKSLFFFGMVLVGFAAQFVDGTLGMGYGAFSASLLITLGLYPAIASASVHTAEILPTLVSGVSHFKLGNVKRELVLPLVIPGVIGGVAGAYFLASIPGKTIKPFIAALLLIMAFWSSTDLLQARSPPRLEKVKPRYPSFWCWGSWRLSWMRWAAGVGGPSLPRA